MADETASDLAVARFADRGVDRVVGYFGDGSDGVLDTHWCWSC